MTNSQRGLPSLNPGRAGDGQGILGAPLSTSGFLLPPTLCTNPTGCSKPQETPQPHLLVLQINPPQPWRSWFSPFAFGFQLLGLHTSLSVSSDFSKLSSSLGNFPHPTVNSQSNKKYIYFYLSSVQMFCARIPTKSPLVSYPYKQVSKCGVHYIC